METQPLYESKKNCLFPPRTNPFPLFSSVFCLLQIFREKISNFTQSDLQFRAWVSVSDFRVVRKMLVQRRVMSWRRVWKSFQAVLAHGLLFSFTLLLALKLDHVVSRSWWSVSFSFDFSFGIYQNWDNSLNQFDGF